MNNLIVYAKDTSNAKVMAGLLIASALVMIVILISILIRNNRKNK